MNNKRNLFAECSDSAVGVEWTRTIGIAEDQSAALPTELYSRNRHPAVSKLIFRAVPSTIWFEATSNYTYIPEAHPHRMVARLSDPM